MTEEIAKYETQAEIIEKVVIGGDLSKLSAEERVSYYRAVCESLGLNPLTKPFEYITLSGKLTLYARKDATDQLRKQHGVSTFVVSRERIDDIYVVTAHATLPNGRQDEEIGAVSVQGLKGEALANAMMKAGTKAKRRVTLSIVGLGMLDETEVETITMTPVTIAPPVQSAWDAHKAAAQELAAISESGKPPAAKKSMANGHTRPWTPEVLRSKLQAAASKPHVGTYSDGGKGTITGKLNDLCGDDDKRHAFINAIFGKGSSKALTDSEWSALDTWLRLDTEGKWKPTYSFDTAPDLAAEEAAYVVNAAMQAESVGALL